MPKLRQRANHYSNRCTSHRIRATDLHNAVLEDIKKRGREALKDDEKMIASIADKLGKSEKDSIRQAERELRKARSRLAELDRLFVKAYEEHAKGENSDRNYNTLVTAYEKEQSELEAAIEESETIISTNRASNENAGSFVELIKQYANIRELTQALLNTLIDRVEVHEPDEVDGELVQKVDVFYKFVSNIG